MLISRSHVIKEKDPMALLEVDRLSKAYENIIAVDGASFSIYEGDIFGFLGPNGSAKNTTINMLTGLARPDKGSIRIGGIDYTGNPKTAQHLIGVVPDESNLYPELTGFDNLCSCAALYGMRKKERETCVHELLGTFGLTGAGKRKFGGFSKGMKRKLTIAAGIIHKPPILFLDEPTTGIDVANAFVPIILAAFLCDLSQTAWSAAIPDIVLVAATSTFLGLCIAVSVNEVFQAQTFSNFFRFPMILLCGPFFPIERLPIFLWPLSYVLPMTYGADILHGVFSANNTKLFAIDLCVLGAFCIFLFAWSLGNIKHRWIL